MLVGCGQGGEEHAASAQRSAAFTVSGVVEAAQGSAVDGDVNDPRTPYRPNNTPDAAQPLPDHVILGGFASAHGTGVPGDRFARRTDRLDVYSVALDEGQAIALYISDHIKRRPTLNDLDLALFDTADPANLIVSSEGTGATESIRVPARAEYRLVVSAFAGVSNYTLTVGPSSTTAAKATALRIEDEFVPGEIIVRFKDQTLPAEKAGDAVQKRARSMGVTAVAGGAHRELLLKLSGRQRRRHTLKPFGRIQRNWGYWRRAVASMGAKRLAKHDTIAAVKALRARKDVESADLNYVRRPSLIPDDEHYRSQWHYPLVHLPQAWELTQGSGSVTIAVIDTGVFMFHPDLAPRLTATGYDFISSPVRANDGDGLDNDPDDVGDGAGPGQSSFHGTHVAATIAAASNNAQGVAGVAWRARIMPVRVLGLGGGTDYDVTQGVRYAMGLPNDSGVVLPKRERADVINLSLGGPGYSQAAQDVYTMARDRGAIIVAAAGNQSSVAPHYPAWCDGVLAVSAVDAEKRLAPYSSFGPRVDIAAPGGDSSADSDGDGAVDGVLSALADDSNGSRVPTYAYYQGTSMAKPHVAGVVSLMEAMYARLKPDVLDVALAAGLLTEDLADNGPSNRDNAFGYGLIDALKAVQAAADLAAGAPLAALLELAPSPLDFGMMRKRLRLTARNAGEDPLAITGISDDADWIEVYPDDIDADGLGTYPVAVDRGALGYSADSATISFTTDNAGTATVSAAAQAHPRSVIGDTGRLYVLLLDPRTLETVARQAAGNVSGDYDYDFGDVAPGRYLIVAGSDADNDGSICDAGEACGGYPALGQLRPVMVGDNNLSGLEFSNSFELIAPARAPTKKGFRRALD